MSSLRLDWCSHEAARFACTHWHYAHRMPIGPMVKIGVWEDGDFVGCVLFARGNTPTLGRPYGLAMTDVAELVRVALREHHAKVSRIVAIALRMLAKRCPGIRLAISFADPSQGHHGGIYQANGWTYTGMSAPDKEYWHGGRWKHSREVRGGAFGRPRRIRLGGRGLTSRVAPGKHRYLMPLDAEMRAQVLPLAKPYPKRERSSESGTPEPTGGDAAMRSARLDQSQTCRVRE